MAKTMNRDEEMARIGNLTITYLVIDGRPVTRPQRQRIEGILETDFERLREIVEAHTGARDLLNRSRRPNQHPEHYTRTVPRQAPKELKREPFQLPVYSVQHATPTSTASKLRDARLEPWKIEKVTFDNVVEVTITT